MLSMENKLREIRKNLGLTLEQLGEPMGVKASQVEKLEKNQRKMTVQWLDRLQKSFGELGYDVKATDIMGVTQIAFSGYTNSKDNDNIQELRINPKKQLPIEQNLANIPSPGKIPVTGYIRGDLVIFLTDNTREVELVSLPEKRFLDRSLDEKYTFALIIEADTDLFRKGWKVLYCRYPDAPAIPDDCLGELCVVKRKDGYLLIRDLEAGTMPGRYHLKLKDRDMLNQEIEWAAKIEAIVR